MLGFVLGTMTGGVMGVFAMCLFIAGKREDEALERCRIKRKEIIDHGVCICFVNSQGEELFRLADGESLVQNLSLIHISLHPGPAAWNLLCKRNFCTGRFCIL